jgi:hypothetical protein
LVFVAQTAPLQTPECGGPCGYSGQAGDLRVAAPQIAGAEIVVDGSLDEPVWERAARLTDFTQYQPVEGAPASQPTEVLVVLTEEDLLFGILAYDSEPDQIRATLAERDNVASSDDFVRLVIDTFNDQRRAYAFTVNPLGIQQDGLWLEGGSGGGRNDPVDDNQDFVWESQGRITARGYQVEVRIPIKSLRFPDQAVQDWGLQVLRTIQRDGYREAWAPISAESSNRLAQSGTLQGLEGLDPGLFLEFNPVVTALQSGVYDAETASLVHADPDVEFGLNATYGITSNLTLDATYNPDFSQVEADAGQITVNERFAIFLPEKRPFFLEGTELFELPERIVYTRSIVDPIVGAKITGKVGGLNLGYLGSVDKELAVDDEAVVNLLRVRADVGASSTLGVVYTDRTRDSDIYNRVLGGDALLVLAQRYRLTLMSAVSRTGLQSGSRVGDGLFLRAGIDRTGLNFMYNIDFQSVSPAFEAQSGFLNRENEASLNGQIRYRYYGATEDRLERLSPYLNFDGHWDHDGFWAGRGLEEWETGVGVGIGFRGNWGLVFNATLAGFEFTPADYEGLFVENPVGSLEPFRPDQDRFNGLRGANGRLRLDTWEKVRGSIQIDWRETPVFERALGVPVEVSQNWSINASFLVFLTQALQGELGVRRSTLDRKAVGERHSSATIPRARVQYQFSPALFLRTILEYDSEERGELRDPATGQVLTRCSNACTAQFGRESHEFYGEVLLSFEPSPGTVFFLGYSRQMDERSAFSFSGFTPREDGLFLKGSYRFRW